MVFAWIDFDISLVQASWLAKMLVATSWPPAPSSRTIGLNSGVRIGGSLDFDRDILRAVQMELRALSLAGLRQAALNRAGNLERRFRAIGFDCLLILRLATTLGEFIEPVGGESASEVALLPASPPGSSS